MLLFKIPLLILTIFEIPRVTSSGNIRVVSCLELRVILVCDFVSPRFALSPSLPHGYRPAEAHRVICLSLD